MARVKRGVQARRRHKKVLKAAKGEGIEYLVGLIACSRVIGDNGETLMELPKPCPKIQALFAEENAAAAA